MLSWSSPCSSELSRATGLLGYAVRITSSHPKLGRGRAVRAVFWRFVRRPASALREAATRRRDAQESHRHERPTRCDQDRGIGAAHRSRAQQESAGERRKVPNARTSAPHGNGTCEQWHDDVTGAAYGRPCATAIPAAGLPPIGRRVRSERRPRASCRQPSA